MGENTKDRKKSMDVSGSVSFAVHLTGGEVRLALNHHFE
jgi:hypothetical protein